MGKVLQQGESYEDDAVKKESNDAINGPEHDTAAPKNDKIKYIALAGVAILVVLVLLGIILMKGMNKNEETAEVTADDTYVEDDNPAAALLNSDPAVTGEYTEDSSSTTDMQDTSSTAEYSNTEDIELRKRGYTADEIEFSREHGISYEDMIAQADADIENQQRQVLASLSDEGSEAYQTLLNMTWLQGADLSITDATYDEFGNLSVYEETKTMNIDYTKVPAKGTQLFLKCNLLDYGVAFMTVAPDRWLQLADSGNILVNVTFEHWNDVIVVKDIYELDAGDRDDYFQTQEDLNNANVDEVQP